MNKCSKSRKHCPSWDALMPISLDAQFGREAIAVVIFLILYVAILSRMIWAYAMKRIKSCSRYTLLFSHVAIRVGSQVSGVIFGVQGFTNPNALVAYLILGAEGYFTLVLCAFRFLMSRHQHNLPNYNSRLEPRQNDNSSRAQLNRALASMNLPLALFYWRQPMIVLHSFLFYANIIIILGGSYLAGADFDHPENGDLQRRLNISKTTRTSGQSVFLPCNFLLLFAILATIIGRKRAGVRKTHQTLILLLIAWFPLIIRGIFGILQAAIWSLSYYNPDNFTTSGFTTRFVVIEYILGVATEWLACLTLNFTYFTSLNDPPKEEINLQERNLPHNEAGESLVPPADVTSQPY